MLCSLSLSPLLPRKSLRIFYDLGHLPRPGLPWYLCNTGSQKLMLLVSSQRGASIRDGPAFYLHPIMPANLITSSARTEIAEMLLLSNRLSILTISKQSMVFFKLCNPALLASNNKIALSATWRSGTTIPSIPNSNPLNKLLLIPFSNKKLKDGEKTKVLGSV